MSATVSPVKKIGLTSLILLITVTIDSVRNLPSTALFGPALIFLYLISACFLLIPGAITSSELTFAFPKKGGVYHWVTMGLGRRVGFLAVWGQWINTLIWFPTILSFVSSSLGFLFFPTLSSNPYFLTITTLLCFWFITFISLFGFQMSARFAIFCALFGLIIPMWFIISLAMVWIFGGKPMHTVFNSHTIFPAFTSLNDWFSLVAIMTSFLGFELIAVHVNDMEDPQKNYPKAIMISVFIVLFTMIMGSLSIAIIIPNSEIILTQGVAQGFGAFLSAYHLDLFLPILVLMMALGCLGEMINWLGAPARGMFQASQDGFLPAWLHHKNRYGAEKNLLVVQAIIVSFICTTFILIPSVNAAYWFLTNLSVEIYMFVYLLMFIAAIVVEFKYPNRARLFAFAKSRFMIISIYLLGCIGCLVTLVIGALPPPNLIISSKSTYQLLFWIGILTAFIPILGIHFVKSRREKALALAKDITIA